MIFMVCYSLHEVKNRCIYFQWKKNTGLLAEVSSFSAKSLFRVIVALNWYCSTHSICSNLRTIDFQTLADSYSALKWLFSSDFMHTGQSNKTSRWKSFLINSSVMILTWNFILDYYYFILATVWFCRLGLFLSATQLAAGLHVWTSSV